MSFRLLPLLALLLAQTVAAAADQPVLRVMSYNIHHAEGLDGRVDVERIARVILDAKADLVGLQEVDRGVERTQRRDLPAELARLTGLQVRFERNIIHQGGDYGNAILSRFPIRSFRNFPLPQKGPGERRGLLEVVVDVGGHEVVFLNTHLDHRADDGERLLGVDELRARVAAAGDRPVIAVGDFNARPDSRPIRALSEFLTDAWSAVGQGPGFTIPVRKPSRRIDYVWITPRSLTPLRMEVLTTEASDHLPIIAEIRLGK